LRVLLVEDNEDHVALVRRALAERGHAVTVALGAKEALALLAREEYDAIALDYQLPDTTGLEALEKIRRRHRGVPVVMVTGWGSEQVAVEALRKGVGDYVVKTPGYERELVWALELAAERTRADRAEAALRTELEQRARTDHLTGLLNRGEMERILRREIRRAGRRRRAFAFVLLDVDGFKQINDRHGHSAGDAVLCHVAGRLGESVRATDFVARWGGDEFAVLLRGAGYVNAHDFASRLGRPEANGRAASGEDLPPVTLSLGLVCAPGPVESLAAVLKWADRALYAAKTAGRDQAKFFVLGEEEGTDGSPGRAKPACGGLPREEVTG